MTQSNIGYCMYPTMGRELSMSILPQEMLRYVKSKIRREKIFTNIFRFLEMS